MFTLDDPGCIPAAILQTLRNSHSAIERVRYFDHLVERPELRTVAEDLDAFVKATRVRGYHCTKELQFGMYESCGLRKLSIEEHIAEVGDLIARTEPDLEPDCRAALNRRRGESDIRYRNGQIWFCLTRDLVSDGTEDFFTYYGGEIVYRAFADRDRCLAVLASLGRPVVVEAAIPASELKLCLELPFARALIAAYSQMINPAFHPENIQGHLLRSVTPAEILHVHEKNAFFAHAEKARRLTSV